MANASYLTLSSLEFCQSKVVHNALTNALQFVEKPFSLGLRDLFQLALFCLQKCTICIYLLLLFLFFCCYILKNYQNATTNHWEISIQCVCGVSK